MDGMGVEITTPRQNVQPRKPVSAYADATSGPRSGVSSSGKRTVVAEDTPGRGTGLTPHGSNKESTRLEKRTPDTVDGRSLSSIQSPTDGSPRLPRRREMSSQSEIFEDGSPSDQSTPQSTSTSTHRRTNVSKRRTSSASDEDQPSGHVTFIGNSVNRSRSKSGETREKSFTAVKPKHKPSIQTKDSGASSSLIYYLAFLSLILAIAVGGWIYYRDDIRHDRTADNWEEMKKEFSRTMKGFNTRFPEQSRNTFKSIYLALSAAMQKAPVHPGILILVSTPGSGTTTCLIRRLLDTVAPYFTSSGAGTDQFVINATLIANAPQRKSVLHDSLETRLSQYGVAAILGLEKLAGDTAIVLHGYADDSVAPYKHSVLLMSLEGEVEQDGCEPERKVEELLNTYWKDLGTDKLSALLTRVTVGVAELKHETRDTLQKQCPELH